MTVPIDRLSIVLVVVLAVGGVGVATQPALAADQWPNTCLEADRISPGSHFGSFGRDDRDVFVVDPNGSEYASITLEFNDVGNPSKLEVFGVNRFIMRMDRAGQGQYFKIDESQFPKQYYQHYKDVNFTLENPKAGQYRSEDAGNDLFARHLIEFYRISGGSRTFEIHPLVEEPICVVLRDAGDRGSSSWSIDYEVRSSNTSDDPENLRRTVAAKDARIETLRSTVTRQNERIAALENATGANESGVRTVVKTKVVERTQVVYQSGDSSSSTKTPGFTALSAVVAVLVLLVLARRR